MDDPDYLLLLNSIKESTKNEGFIYAKIAKNNLNIFNNLKEKFFFKKVCENLSKDLGCEINYSELNRSIWRANNSTKKMVKNTLESEKKINHVLSKNSEEGVKKKLSNSGDWMDELPQQILKNDVLIDLMRNANITEDEYKSLGSVNPHNLMPLINSIQKLIEEKRQKDARKKLLNQ